MIVRRKTECGHDAGYSGVNRSNFNAAGAESLLQDPVTTRATKEPTN